MYNTRPEWIHRSAWGQAWRSLRRRPGFFAATVLTLGFGGGIATAVFSLVDTVLIKPLPFPDADRLVTVFESRPSAREKTSLLAPARVEDWNRLNRSFVAISASYSENVTDTSASEPERLQARRVMGRFFTVYGMPLLAGRAFTAEEERPNGPGAAVISEALWTRRFNRDPQAVGRALTIGGAPFQIVGVVPSTFTGAATDVWLPAQISDFMMQMRDARFLTGIGRLRPGVSVEQGESDLATVQNALAREFPKTDEGWSAEVRSLKEAVLSAPGLNSGRTGATRRGLMLVFGAVALLWAIAVANIAGLTLVQLHRRARELAIRAALGASRAKVIGAVVREGLMIAVAGAAVASALAFWIVALMRVVLERTPRINELALDWRALAFTLITSAIAGCAFSVVPALVGTRARIRGVISAGGRGATSERHRTQQLLVVGQVALSVLLVGSATLLLRSYDNLTRVETGFDPAGTVTFHVGARWDEDRTRIAQLQQQLLSNLEQLPHVQAAGMANFLPASGATLRYQFRIDGITGPNEDGSITAGSRTSSAGYLRALRMPLVAGSLCAPSSLDPKAPPTMMVNQKLVDVYAPNQNLVGRTLRMTEGSGRPFTIVGIVGNVAEDALGTDPVPYTYSCMSAGWWPDPEYVVRTADPRAFAADLRRIVRELDSSRAIFGLRPVQAALDASLDRPRLDAGMLATFASAALTLAAIGLYSLFMLMVSDRTRELAVRLAVGASPQQLVALVFGGAGRLLAGGIVLGVLLTLAADRFLRGLLFGVSALDARALATAVLTLGVVAAIAVAGPAFRAARVSPTEALRGE
jgi:putative ABC transport system permease protein